MIFYFDRGFGYSLLFLGLLIDKRVFKKNTKPTKRSSSFRARCLISISKRFEMKMREVGGNKSHGHERL